MSGVQNYMQLPTTVVRLCYTQIEALPTRAEIIHLLAGQKDREALLCMEEHPVC